MTSAVSRIGTARMMIGSSSVATVVPASFQLADRLSAASAKPITWLPESPMNTAAGLPRRRLKGRKPRHANASDSESALTSGFGSCVKVSTAKYVQAITASVAARPSMLSSRLKAFVMPTSQTSASDRWRRCRWTRSAPAVAGDQITRTAAAICAPSLATGGSARTSSARPAAKRMRQPPTSVPRIALSDVESSGISRAVRFRGWPSRASGDDADSAERRRDLLVPAVAPR